jgi:hypothetical protein
VLHGAVAYAVCFMETPKVLPVQPSSGMTPRMRLTMRALVAVLLCGLDVGIASEGAHKLDAFAAKVAAFRDVWYDARTPPDSTSVTSPRAVVAVIAPAFLSLPLWHICPLSLSVSPSGPKCSSSSSSRTTLAECTMSVSRSEFLI